VQKRDEQRATSDDGGNWENKLAGTSRFGVVQGTGLREQVTSSLPYRLTVRSKC
jgi:hypothetical protein